MRPAPSLSVGTPPRQYRAVLQMNMSRPLKVKCSMNTRSPSKVMVRGTRIVIAPEASVRGKN